MKKLIVLNIIFFIISCGSIKSTIQNIDEKAVVPKIIGDRFILNQVSSNSNYAFDPNYPINLGFYKSENANELNVKRFFNGITSKNGKKLVYTKIDTCCPYPSKNNPTGAGTIDKYEVYEEENDTEKWFFYININDRGQIDCPKGFLIKK